MRQLRAFANRLGNLVRRNRAKRISAQSWRATSRWIQTQAFVPASPLEARRQALIRLGGAEQARQAHRDRRTLPWVADLIHDLRYGLRMMARNPSFTAVAVLTMAIGIGATSTAFTWINGVLLRPLGGVTDPTVSSFLKP